MPLLKGIEGVPELHNSNIQLLVSCCTHTDYNDGGLFLLDFNKKEYIQLFNVNSRGLLRVGDQFMAATNSNGILVYNYNFVLIRQKKLEYNDVHGMALLKDQAVLIAETPINAIGCYDIHTLNRIGEIRLHQSLEDINHVNDLFVDGRYLYISMFAPSDDWKKTKEKSRQHTGCIIKVDIAQIDPGTKTEIDPQNHLLRWGLVTPHSVTIDKGEVLYHNSLLSETVIGNQTIKSEGYTRGLAVIGDKLFIGQSNLRHLDPLDGEQSACGVKIYDRAKETSHFIPLPAKEVYAILPV